MLSLGLEYAFMRHAYVAGGAIALASAAIGYFVTLRRQTFAAHALSHVGFTGAAGALLLGLSPYLGLFSFTLAAALALGLAGERLRQRDVGIGMVLMFALGLGVLFLSLYAAGAQQAMSMLFGSIVGIDTAQAAWAAALALACLLGLLALYRPLCLVSLNAEAARARGIAVRRVDLLFVTLVAVCVAIAVPVIGALLIFAFLVGPPAAAQALARGIGRGLLLSMALALALTWGGLAASYAIGLPASTWIASLSFALYLLAQVARRR